MPTTRAKVAQAKANKGKSAKEPETTRATGEKREVDATETNEDTEAKAPPAKKQKSDYAFHPGTVERGHIYFFYRPKVQQEEAHDIDDVKKFHMLLVPRPPEFSTHTDNGDSSHGESDEQEMNLVQSGGDVVPAPEPKDRAKKQFRLITIGKKRLPDPEVSGRKEVFWGTVVTYGDDLKALEEGLGENTYETKTRGTRHEEPARIAGRGVYAIVNKEGNTPSKNATHLGYHLSHPADLGEVQTSLGVHEASSFVLQVKNPLAPPTGPQQTGLSKERRAEYPDAIMDEVFGRGKKGTESYGLRFSTAHVSELLNHEGTEVLLIASHTGDDGNDQALGEERGEAMREAGQKESEESTGDIFKELAFDKDTFPAEPLEGKWI